MLLAPALAALLAAPPPLAVAARRVVSRLDLPGGTPTTEVQLDVSWGKAVTVYLLDAEPAVTRAADGRGRPVAASAAAGGRFAPDGSPASLSVRLGPVPRSADTLAVVEGRFGAVIAERMIDVVFDDLAAAVKGPVERKEAGVAVRLDRLADRGEGTWVASLRVEYPSPLPEFESFQSWLPENRAALRRKGLAKLYPAAGYEIDRQGRTSAAATYRFRGLPPVGADGLKEWELLYRTPASVREVTVPFQLKDVPLP